MADITFDVASGAEGTSVTSVSWTHTLGTTADPFMFVTTHGGDSVDSDRTATGATWDVGGTDVGFDSVAFSATDSNWVGITGMYLHDPSPTGTKTVRATFGGTCFNPACCCMSFFGVRPVTAVGTGATNTAQSTTPSVTINVSHEKNWIISSLATDDNNGIGANDTQRHEIEQINNDTSFNTQTTTGITASTHSASWTQNNQSYVAGGVEIWPIDTTGTVDANQTAATCSLTGSSGATFTGTVTFTQTAAVAALTAESFDAAVTFTQTAAVADACGSTTDPVLYHRLMSHWYLNEAGTATRVDKVRSYDMTQSGGVSSVTGLVAGYNATHFTRVNSTDLRINHDSAFDGDRSFTIAGWVLLQTKPGADMGIFSKRTDTDLDWNLFYDDSADRFVFEKRTAAGTFSVTATDVGSPALDTWYFLAGEYDQPAGTIKIYSGQNDVSTTSSLGTSTYTNTARIKFGDYDAVGNFSLDGSLSLWSFWNATLVGDWQNLLWGGCGGGNAFVLDENYAWIEPWTQTASVAALEGTVSSASNTGTISFTQTAAVAAATASLNFIGSITFTQTASVAALSGFTDTTGTIAYTQTAAIAAATAGQNYFADIVYLQTAATAAATGDTDTSGTISFTQTPAVAAATASLNFIGSITFTQTAAVAAATGTHTDGTTGTVSFTQTPATASLTGESFAASVASIQTSAIAALTGSLNFIGTITFTQTSAIASLTGSNDPDITGTISFTQTPSTVSASGDNGEETETQDSSKGPGEPPKKTRKPEWARHLKLRKPKPKQEIHHPEEPVPVPDPVFGRCSVVGTPSHCSSMVLQIVFKLDVPKPPIPKSVKSDLRAEAIRKKRAKRVQRDIRVILDILDIV